MQLNDAIKGRRAVRNFTQEDVPKEIISELIHSAAQAPSAMNQQPWAFAILRGRDRLRNYSDRAKICFAMKAGGHVPVELREMLQDPRFDMFYNAPCLIVIYARPGGLNPEEDCCLAAQNLMLAAHGLGLGTCPIGLARPWLNLPEVKKELGIPPELTAVFPLIVGRPAETPPPVARKAAEILLWQ